MLYVGLMGRSLKVLGFCDSVIHFSAYYPFVSSHFTCSLSYLIDLYLVFPFDLFKEHIFTPRKFFIGITLNFFPPPKLIQYRNIPAFSLI